MARTLIRIFLDRVAGHRTDAIFLRKRKNRWETIDGERALTEVEALALGLRRLGVGPGTRVALLSETRYEWAVADLAVMGLGAIVVPIYPTLTPAQVLHILADSEATLAIGSTPVQVAKLHAAMESLPTLRAVVHMDPAEGRHPADHAWDTVLGHGLQARASDPLDFRAGANLVQPDQLATIIYTSGTTGEPKGAMLSHDNIGSNVEACLEAVPLSGSDVSLSFLPLCHIFERMAGLYAMLAAGVTIAYAENFDSVPRDVLEIHPTIVNAVPRFYEKVYARVMERGAALHGLQGRLFRWGIEQGRARARAHFAGRSLAPRERLQAAIADRLVLKKIRTGLGGRLRLCISGGAPLSADVMEFFIAIGVTVLEGYGLTETSPVICLNRPGHERPGSVGPPLPGVQIRIGEDGEILTRGPHVMQGYYHNEAATRAAIRDGWFHTGDVGRIEPDGRLVITDRLKDLLVTAGGKKVAPQPLEAHLKASPWITEAVLLGDRMPYIVALIVPDLAAFEVEAKARGWTFSSRADLIERPEVRAQIQSAVDVLNAEQAPFEKVRKFALLPRELTADAGEITPTLKVKRRVVTEHFAETIAELYAGPHEGRASA
jgi:long-chain acyl-CoA synthetase